MIDFSAQKEQLNRSLYFKKLKSRKATPETLAGVVLT